MEQKVRVLHAKISELRKGFKNQWKSWFGGKRPDAEREGVTIRAGASHPSYTCTALESQIRLFADLAFMLKDYDLALTHYRMVSADYKADNAMKNYAATLEMIGVCLYFLNGSRREIETNLEQAIVMYQRERCTVYATRATFVLFDCYRSWRRNLDASRVLMRASDHETDNDCRAAIMLELAGFCFLQMTPSQPRKYAFYLVLAGFRYNLAQQRRHTVRCYSTALHMYNEKGWAYVEDHLNFALGRQSNALKEFSLSMQYLMMLLRDCKQPAGRQEFFLKELVQVAVALRRDTSEPDTASQPVTMPLPRVDDDSITVGVNPPTNQLRTVTESGQPTKQVWVNLETKLLDVYRAIRLANGFALSDPPGHKWQQCCYVGEEVVIQVVLQNPLQTKLPLTNLSLVCTLTNDKIAIDDDAFEAKSRNLVLPPRSNGQYCEAGAGAPIDGPIALHVLPKIEGDMTIHALQWQLLGELTCSHVIKLKGARMNKTPGQRKSSTPVYSTDRRLELRVCPPMPLLQVVFDDQPHTLLSGEIRRVTMKLTNIGSTADMESVTMAMSHPRFCFIGDGENDVPSAVSPRHECKPSIQDLTQQFAVVTLIAGTRPNLNGQLAPSESAEFTLWLHGSSPGQHMLSFLFYYDSSPQHRTTEFRWLRYSMEINVEPSLSIGAIATETGTRSLLGLTLTNEGQLPLTLRSLSCMSCCWEPEPGSDEPQTVQELEPSQRHALHVQLSRTHVAVSEDAPREILCCRLPGGKDSSGSDSCIDAAEWHFVLRASSQNECSWMRRYVFWPCLLLRLKAK